MSKTTYFYHHNVHVVDLDSFAGAEGKPCPPNLLLDIRTLLQEFPESVESAERSDKGPDS